MGKRYYCEYCDKTIVATPSTVKTHNKGAVHQKLVNEHYQQFKDPETILLEESTKKPCSRFLSGQCPFGSICRYSHYTQDQIIALRNYVAQKKQQPPEISQSFGDIYEKFVAENKVATNENVVYDSNGFTHVLPWSYNANFETYGEKLPPSLRKLNIEDIINSEITHWG